eukprot:12142832-Karenia_brevis.AAC.1
MAASCGCRVFLGDLIAASYGYRILLRYSMRGAPSYLGKVQVGAGGFRMADRQWNNNVFHQQSLQPYRIRHANRGDRGYR